VTSSASIKEVADKIKAEHGVTTILCNNAGIGRTNLITEATDANLDKIFKINTISHWYTVREFLPDMIKAKKGHIISTASMASYTTCAGMVDYCVSKAAAMAFTDGMSFTLHFCIIAFWRIFAIRQEASNSLSSLRRCKSLFKTLTSRICQ
jgi:short-subunit dehydrogenase